MRNVMRREFELLEKICNQKGIPIKLASELINAANKHSYENVSRGARISEYENLIKYLSKSKSIGDQ
ncbi:MAG: hypothetical protein LPK00_10335 [Bacillaceae bacterium]|nr:hypothetical protein [Bacillaceae bacterium]